MRSVILTATILLAIATPGIAAEPAKFGNGTLVMPTWEAVTKMGDVTVDEANTGFVHWIVQEVKGDLLLVGQQKKGWVQQSQVMALADAADYYSVLIKANDEFIKANEQLIDPDRPPSNASRQRAWAYRLRRNVLSYETI